VPQGDVGRLSSPSLPEAPLDASPQQQPSSAASPIPASGSSASQVCCWPFVMDK